MRFTVGSPGQVLPRSSTMKLSRKTSRAIWVMISIIGVVSMIAFTLLPVISYP